MASVRKLLQELERRVVDLEEVKVAAECKLAELEQRLADCENNTERNAETKTERNAQKNAEMSMSTGETSHPQSETDSKLASTVKNAQERLDDLENGESVCVEWIIEDFLALIQTKSPSETKNRLANRLLANKLRSSTVPVAGRDMGLFLQWSFDGKLEIGITYDHRMTNFMGGLTSMPIAVGGSTITAMGETLTVPGHYQITATSQDAGFCHRVARDAVGPFLENGNLRVRAKIRVARGPRNPYALSTLCSVCARGGHCDRFQSNCKSLIESSPRNARDFLPIVMKAGGENAIAKAEKKVNTNSADPDGAMLAATVRETQQRLDELEKWDSMSIEWILDSFSEIRRKKMNIGSKTVPLGGREMHVF
jgi:hypothetical protein